MVRTVWAVRDQFGVPRTVWAVRDLELAVRWPEQFGRNPLVEE